LGFNKHIPPNQQDWENFAYFCDKCKKFEIPIGNWSFVDCPLCVHYGNEDTTCWDCENGTLYIKKEGEKIDVKNNKIPECESRTI
jgi:hypothetical protein